MDLGTRLANLSLAEIASMLNEKQQEVLLTSISVAATFIQQLSPAPAHNQHHPHFSDLDSDPNPDPNPDQNPDPNPDSNPDSNLDLNPDLNPDLNADSNPDSNPDLYSDRQLSTTDEQTLATIRDFAEELKARRKAIRLSQKGAAQSLRAFTNGEQPCTDAIIYHFENLQLEPDRAIQLIPLLKDWLEWAEKFRLGGQQLPMLSAVTKVPRERKRKVVLFNEKAKQYLEDAFSRNNHPDRYQLDVISRELDIPTRSIRKWFTNRRQRKRFAEKFSPF